MLTPEHAAQRRGLITSTRAASALGKNRYQSPSILKDELLGRAVDEPDEETEAMAVGVWAEPLLRQYAAERVGGKLLDAPFVAHANGIFGDSADGLLEYNGELAVLEAKTAGFGVAKKWGEPGTDAIPDAYLIQAHWHLMHWPEAQRCILPVLLGGYSMRRALYIVERNDVVTDGLRRTLEAWHKRYIVNDEAPPVTAQDDTWLKRIRSNDELRLIADAAFVDEARAVFDKRANIKACQEDLKLHEARLKKMLDQVAEVEWDGNRVTWRNSKDRVETDWKGVVEAVGADAETIREYTTTKAGSRPLRVIMNGGDDE